MENILFKVSYPAEFHAQTAVEAAIQLHPLICSRLTDLQKIVLSTQESALRIISKEGPLHNPADRDHCLQYMVAIALLHGTLDASHYENEAALDPRIDALREKMQVIEDKQFSIDYLDPEKRSIANSIQIYFKDGTKTEKITIEYPLGHRFRREESLPFLEQKFKKNLAKHYSSETSEKMLQLFHHQEVLEKMPVHGFMDLWVWK